MPSGGRSVKVWDLQTGQELVDIDTVEAGPVAFSPDGKYLAVGSWPEVRPGTVSICDAATGTTVLVLRGHAGSIGSVAWSPDGRRLASAGPGPGAGLTEGQSDSSVRVWDVKTGQELLALAVHLGTEPNSTTVKNLLFSPDGKRIALRTNRYVQVWDTTPLAERPLSADSQEQLSPPAPEWPGPKE
jgi:WD40 repeat protein